MLRTVIFENPSVVTKMSESKKDTNQDIDSNQCSEAKFLSEKKNRIVGDYPEIDILSEMFAIRDMILYLLQPKVKTVMFSPQNVFKERQVNQLSFQIWVIQKLPSKLQVKANVFLEQ